MRARALSPRQKAKVRGKTFYVGPLCPEGHAGAKRYASNGSCAACAKAAAKAFRLAAKVTVRTAVRTGVR